MPITSTSLSVQLARDLKEALIKTINASQPDKSIRFSVFSVEVEPLSPKGWSLSIKASAQLSPLDKKIETEEKETP